jgi:DNA polymerase IV
MDDLLALGREQAGEIWGSVWGERLFHWLRGEDFDRSSSNIRNPSATRTCSRPRCAPRKKPGPWRTSCCTKPPCACARRACGPSNIGLAIGFAVPRGENTPVSRFGVPARGWRSEIKLSECQDNQTLIAALRRLWESRPSGEQYEHPYFIGVQLNNLVPDRLHTLALFDGLEEEQSRTRLQRHHGPDQRQVRHEHARPRRHAHRIQGRAHAHRVQQHSGFVP